MEKSLPLHLCHVHNFSIIINRLHALLHSIAVALLIYYRASFLFQESKNRTVPTLPWLLVFASELLLSLAWLLRQAYGWRPVSRTVFPERLPSDDKLPAIDVFICTADPNKEPTVEVMNTVISAMALDYPPEKLHVFLSDDGGSDITLRGTKEAWNFARSWVPFCRRYDIKTSCPEAYFSCSEDDDHGDFKSSEFKAERQKIEQKYEMSKERVRRVREEHSKSAEVAATVSNSRDHPSVIEVIRDNSNEELQEDQVKMPLLVYVSREKRPSHRHNFKAGALNVLLRVSGMMSNSPYILVLDCDMYCNDPTSARQSMCYHFDPEISPSLAFVQFPQKFRNISKDDIYDSEIRAAFRILWHGMDGLEGPVLSGTNFYIKREALLGSVTQEGIDLMALKRSFGPSNEFIKTLRQDYKPSFINDGESSSMLLEEAKVLASCSYENQTTWGTKVGFMYFCVVEDYFTSFTLHCKGWKSVYLNPPRPQFLGTSTTNLSDLLIQGTRWASGLTEVAISRFCPLIYGPLRMSLLHSLCYAELAFWPLLFSLPLWGFALIPQLCLINGIPLYPEVSDPYFSIFLFIFISALSKNLYEIFATGGQIRTWTNERRIWMIKSVTSDFYGCVDAILSKLGMSEASFLPTSKVTDDEQVKRYEMGVFDFQAPTMLLAPLATIILVNIASLVGGVVRMVAMDNGDWKMMVGQISLSFYILIANYAIIEGMIIRKDKASIPSYVTLLSVVFSMIILSIGSIVLC
ncbi:PREDICTED: cellulose synthase-like protein G2 [Theobroma cacao]|uniref:Cellulose synthase-like protein G2 n=1 Tax=Theobroma cacao TaxID=3641 RepID=A0AB32VA22_THECC|nr:PREDICTED: cellulose synthase-like protein G2 [Theobroma cacao]